MGDPTKRSSRRPEATARALPSTRGTGALTLKTPLQLLCWTQTEWGLEGRGARKKRDQHQSPLRPGGPCGAQGWGCMSEEPTHTLTPTMLCRGGPWRYPVH